jgi:NADPH2:quinone reductase
VRAAVVSEVGTIPEPGEAPEPVRGEGEALVAVEAVPLNPIDVNVAAGRFYGGHPPLPFVAGSEAVGRVLEGETLATGTLVWAHGAGMGVRANGGLAERIAVPEDILVPLPDDVDPALAGALGVAGMAGWLPVAVRAPVREGETVLVLGCTGTVGIVAMQGARVLGAGRVVAAGRRPQGLERAARLGADATVALEGDVEAMAAAFRNACGGEGPTLVVDPLWGLPVVAAARAAARHGRIVHIGQSAGPEAPLLSADVRGKELEILGYSNLALPRDVMAREYQRLVGLGRDGRIAVEVETVPFERFQDAWRRQAEGAGVKLVVTL